MTPDHNYFIFGFLRCDEWTSINGPLSEGKKEEKKIFTSDAGERPGQVLQSRFAFTEQHLSITSDLTRSLGEVAVVSGCMCCSPTSCLS